MDPKNIRPETLDTWGRLAPKSFGAWTFKLALTLGYLIAPWFLVPWRYAALCVLLIWAIQNSVKDAIPEIVALTKQEMTEPASPRE